MELHQFNLLLAKSQVETFLSFPSTMETSPGLDLLGGRGPTILRLLGDHCLTPAGDCGGLLQPVPRLHRADDR